MIGIVICSALSFGLGIFLGYVGSQGALLLARHCQPANDPAEIAIINRRIQDDLRRTWPGFYDRRYRR